MPSLILNGRGTDARLDSHHVVISRHEGDASSPPRHVPLHDVDRVVVVGQPHISMAVLCELMKRGLPVSFLTPAGRWLGTLSPDNNLNAARRLAQYDRSRDETLSVPVARALIAAKLQNARRVLQRLAANRSETQLPAHAQCQEEIKRLIGRTTRETDLESLRGLEGLGSARYFGQLKRYFPEHMPFPERSRRPPRDPANALLSWTYTIVLGELDAQVRSHGLDPGIGFLHRLT
ncbi:MAG: CRISPR-associated endonuclease Cas1, partial [Lentisphaerae bacterium]|nr:CRISPR-associated endonuclease Cas1 [Lentisphaerota bacterium]